MTIPTAPTQTGPTFADLVRFRVADFVPSDDVLFDAALAAEEGRLELRSICDKLAWEDLLSPAGTGLVEVADLSEIPYVTVAADDPSADAALRGRVVLGLPFDFSRLVRLRLAGHGGSVTAAASEDSLRATVPGYNGFGYTANAVGTATLATPSVSLVAYAFRGTDFPGYDPDAPVAGSQRYLRTALAVAPGPYSDTGAAFETAQEAVAELLYTVLAPDPENATGAIRDACAWGTVSRLLSQDPETRGQSVDALQRRDLALSTLPRRSGTIIARVGLSL